MNSNFRKGRLIFPLLALGLIAIFGYQNCGPFKGTETGNPMSESQSQIGSSRNPTQTESRELGETICNKIKDCFQNDPSACLDSVMRHSDLARRFSASSSTALTTLVEAAAAEARGELNPSATDSENCQADIKAIACSDPRIQGAIDTTNSRDIFHKADDMVPTSGPCRRVFP